MRKVYLGTSDLEVPVIGVGMQHINRIAEKKERVEYLDKCLELGLNFFDHADVYGIDGGPFGYCEELFKDACAMGSIKREDLIIQTKCGFTDHVYPDPRPYKIDNSKDYIIQAAENSLRRLGTDYLDVLLIHAPDALVEPEEVAEAFDILYESGKVKHFGVSNHNTLSLALLMNTVKQPLIVNQLRFNVVDSGIVSGNMYVNMDTEKAVDRDDGILNFCRLHEITIQCWGAMRGKKKGSFIGNEDYPDLNRKLAELGEKYNVTPSSIAISWILRHPAKMIPLTGTTSIKHLEENAMGADIRLTHTEWYEIWKAAGNYAR